MKKIAITFGALAFGASLAAQVGVALQRQLLLEHLAEKKRIEADLQIACEIQRGLLPIVAPEKGDNGSVCIGFERSCSRLHELQADQRRVDQRLKLVGIRSRLDRIHGLGLSQ